jgi:hypothetical protein
MVKEYKIQNAYEFIPNWKSDFAKRPIVEFFLKLVLSTSMSAIITSFLYETAGAPNLSVWMAIFFCFFVGAMLWFSIFWKSLHEFGRRKHVLKRIRAPNALQAVNTHDSLKKIELEYELMIATALDRLKKLLADCPSEEVIKDRMNRLNSFRSVNPILDDRLKEFEVELEEALSQREATRIAENVRKKRVLLFEETLQSAQAAREKRELTEQESRRARLFDIYVSKIDREFSKVGSIVVREFEKRTKRNPYGHVIEANTEAASREFLKTINFSQSEAFNSISGFENLHKFRTPAFDDFDSESIFLELHAYIAEKVTNFNQKSGVSVVDMTPIEFEHYVASELRSFGWKAEVTKASGDQGIDVIAERGPFKVGIQCKYYKGSVPNKAVQEAFTGKSHYGLNGAAVVTTGSFTKSALEVAKSTGVVALSHHLLGELHERFGLR